MIFQKDIYYQDGAIEISRNIYKRDNSDMPLHTHSFLTISLVLRGNLIEFADNSQHQAKSGHLSIKPAELFHSDIFSEDTTLLSLKVFDWSYYRLHFSDWQWLSESLCLQHFLQIIQARNKKENIEQFRNFLLQRLDLQKLENMPKWLLEVHTMLLNNLHLNPSIAQLAKKVNKHPVHLSRVFNQFFGMDIKAYKNHLCLHFGIENILDNREKLSNIAYDFGFADQSHFCRTFKKIMTITPKKAIKLLNV